MKFKKPSNLLNNIKTNIENEDKVNIKMLLSSKEDSNYFILFLLACFSHLPTPVIPLLSCFFGFLMALVSFQILINKKTLVLPKFIENIRIKRSIVVLTIEKINAIFEKIEKITKIRLIVFFYKKKQLLIVNLLNLIAALCIVTPVPMLSIFPGFGVMFSTFGILNKDGLFVFLGELLNILSVILYVAFFIFGKIVIVKLKGLF